MIRPFIAVLLLSPFLLQAQDARVLSFDAASVKASTLGQSGTEGSKRSRVETAPKSITLRNATLSECLQWAYNLKSFQISGPDALDDERYDIRAVLDSEVPVSRLRLMLQGLLMKRFQIELHRETRPMPVLELTIANGGPKLPPRKPETTTHSADSLPRVEDGGFVFADTTMPEFAAKLSQLRGVELPVIDRTGINGVYDITLKHAADAVRQGDGDQIADLLQDQLKLKFKAAKAPMEVLVVDRIGRLTEN